MKQFLISLLALHFLLCGYGQEEGIKFQKGLTWSEIKTKAREENKYIFMDCYATWCGPCKFMSKNIFTNREVGEYFNNHFISVKVQMDKTDADSDEVKQWYTEAKKIEEDFSVNSLPTYLYFSPDGKPVHRTIGSTKEYREFISKSSDALKPETQYYTLIDHYKEHLNDSVFLRNALETALSSSDEATASAIGDAYVHCVTDPYLKVNLEIIYYYVSSTKNIGFKVLFDNPAKVDRVDSLKDEAESRLRAIISKEEVTPILDNFSGPVNWDSIGYLLKKKYPGYADRIIAESKPEFYGYGQYPDWNEFVKTTFAFLSEYGNDLSAYVLNELCWHTFRHISDKNTLQQILKWSKRTIECCPACDIGHIDTYANLLYKIGDTAIAIAWEKKAIETGSRNHSPDAVIASCRETLAKMEKGEKTWKE